MKRIKIDLAAGFEKLESDKITWKKYEAEGLDLDYSVILPRTLADELMEQLENSVEYYTGDLTKVRIFGKYQDIPRQQVAFGDTGIVYKFSGVTLPAKPWLPTLKLVRDLIEKLTPYSYNFVLVNRYRSGADHVGEHRDNEGELDPSVPIASLSLGQQREFVFRHADTKKKVPEKRDIAKVKINLQHGSLLLMNPPSNKFWYHSLPPRKNAPGVRINLTFRKIK